MYWLAKFKVKYSIKRGLSVQASLVPIRIIQQLPANQGSADLKAIGLGDDGFEYALKRIEDHPLLPISEWMGYQLSRAVGLFTPDFAPVWLDEETPAFGSRWEQTAQIGVPPNPIEIAHFFGGGMRSLTEPIFAVDAFLPNEDRHGRNFMWRSTVGADPILTTGDAAKNLDYLEVVHVFIRRSNQGCPALSEARQALGSHHPPVGLSD